MPRLTEDRLVQQIVLHLPAYLEAHLSTAEDPHVRWRREVPVGRSIADVVALVTRGEPQLPYRSALSAAESVVLANLRQHGPMSLRGLVARCGPGTEAAASRLLSQEIVRRRKLGRDHVLTLAPGWARGFRLIAIEAKLARWRDALAQAITYRAYADAAYVAMPATFGKPPSEVSSVFKAAGVGLLLVDEVTLRRVVTAARSSGHDWRREFVLSRLAG